jgi:cyanophycinase
MKYSCKLLLAICMFTSSTWAQNGITPKGTLFILGGGIRSYSLMQSLVSTAQLSGSDYIVVLPMSSEEPDTSFFYIQQDLQKVCNNTVANLNFTTRTINNKVWLDSLRKAKLIFITGGDQNRFMKVVLHTPVHHAIENAYAGGSTIAGTSAGAAVMSKQMITGNEILGDSIKSGSFKSIRYNTVEVKEGLGLVNNAIIDQHFVARSRYNRLLSVLADFPALQCIGIDEGAAISITGKTAVVHGDGQVLTFGLVNPPRQKQKGLVSVDKIMMRILVKGEVFYLK